ncbi:MAG TPA: hypothetical protein VG520_09575, partial [Candidatus Dormibacteraeota bacterium]|nr:hypothetical protein [Candidatus Dormibacteraeota bacterium]
MSVNDPFSPADLAHYGLKPLNNACGHLDNSTGITGAAPIWNKDFVAALAGSKPTWYTIPRDVVQMGTGDNADFYLPGTQSTAASGNCFYYGPAPSPVPAGVSPTCAYGGVSAPTPRPAPTPPVPPTLPPAPTRTPHKP